MQTFTLDTAIGLNMTHAFFYAESVNAAVWNRARLVEAKLRGRLHDTGATFAPAWGHSGSLSWLYIWCLHDTKCHTGGSHSGVSSSQLLYQGENFTPVRNFATVSCKHETTTHFGLKLVCRWTGTGNACAIFAIFNRMCILSTWSVPTNNRDMKWSIIM